MYIYLLNLKLCASFFVDGSNVKIMFVIKCLRKSCIYALSLTVRVQTAVHSCSNFVKHARMHFLISLWFVLTSLAM